MLRVEVIRVNHSSGMSVVIAVVGLVGQGCRL